jgi:hypothetical protein
MMSARTAQSVADRALGRAGGTISFVGPRRLVPIVLLPSRLSGWSKIMYRPERELSGRWDLGSGA